jgi:crotonobetainyl-CoA:carnitine CoA-transferase CaiB-like acyl-CoA transferase
VVKVEPPTGDLTRLTQPQRHRGMGPLALNVNRNKRSVALDLKTPAGRAALGKLVADADVLITNMRPSALRRLQVDYESVAQANPRLIYCSAQGFRGDSDRADLAAYDEIVQAASGTVDLMHRATGTPSYMPTILGDKVCSLTIVYSVLAALVHQRATGQGQHIEVPMTDVLVAFNLIEHLGGHTFEPRVGDVGFNRSMTPTHRAVRTKDGLACILPYTERNVRDFFTAAGRPDLAEDPRYVHPVQRSRHYGELYAEIERLAAERSTAEWAQLCAQHSIPFASVLTLDEVATDPYLAEGGVVTVAEHPTEGQFRQIGLPVRFSATPVITRRHCPATGQHTAEVLAELGYHPEQIAALTNCAAERQPA